MKHIKTTIDNIVNEVATDLLNEKHKSGFINPNDVDDFEPMTYDYLIKRHKGLPKEYFEPTDIKYDPDEFAVSIVSPDLNEGLIKTYPTKQTLDFVCNNLTKKGYPISPNNFKVGCPNDDKTIFGHITLMVDFNYLNKEINDILIDSFNSCGYHLGSTFNRVDRNGDRCIVFQFEPKFQTGVTNPNLGNLLYHVTTANAARKIMKNGFCPSNRPKHNFNYDSRCYFFTVYDKQLFSDYIGESNKKNMIGDNAYNNDFEIITVDRNLIPDIKFFTDPNFTLKLGVFTYSNIPPSAVVKREKL